VVQAVERELEAVGDAEFVIHLAQVVLDDLLCGADLVGDLFVPHAAGDAADDGELFLGELWLDARVGERGGLGAVGLDDPADRLVVDPSLAVGDLADALDEEVGGDGAGHDATHSATVELDDVGLIGLDDLHDQLGIGVALDQVGDGVDGAGDQLAFEDDDICGVALQGALQIGEGLGLGDHADIVFESEDLLHSDAIDGLRVGKDHPDSGGSGGLGLRAGINGVAGGFFGLEGRRHYQALRKYWSITAAAIDSCPTC
jgi:hypothetical protein